MSDVEKEPVVDVEEEKTTENNNNTSAETENENETTTTKTEQNEVVEEEKKDEEVEEKKEEEVEEKKEEEVVEDKNDEESSAEQQTEEQKKEHRVVEEEKKEETVEEEKKEEVAIVEEEKKTEEDEATTTSTVAAEKEEEKKDDAVDEQQQQQESENKEEKKEETTKEETKEEPSNSNSNSISPENKRQSSVISALSAAALISPIKKQNPKEKTPVVASTRHHHVVVNSSSVKVKQEARQQKQLLQGVDRANKATSSALRSIDDIVAKGKGFSQVHTMVENLNREEEQLFVEVPKKIGRTKIPRVDNLGRRIHSPSTDTSAQVTSTDRSRSLLVQAEQNDGISPERTNNADEENNTSIAPSPFRIEPSPAPQKKKITTVAEAGVEKLIPLPLRNKLPTPDVVSPSRFKEIPEPSENKKDLVREKKEKELEKVLVRPGQKCPPPKNHYVPEENRKPVMKVSQDFLPSCLTKTPAHWPEPEKAQKKSTVVGMKFSSSPLKKKEGEGEETIVVEEEGENTEYYQEEAEAETAAVEE
jgi:hypothetical protein